MNDLSTRAAALAELAAEVENCRLCPRLVAWRELVAREKRASYQHEEYWGRPIAGFGDPAARLLVVGLAPAAHGGNRTGRIFTGDRSGDWLFRALFNAGFANQPHSVSRSDGLRLSDAYVTAAVRSAPPDNKPTPQERDNCQQYLLRELELLEDVSVIVPLGAFAYQALWHALGRMGMSLPRPRPRFGHGAEVELERFTLLSSFHPSQQNTFTGRLTEQMLDEVFLRAAALCTG